MASLHHLYPEKSSAEIECMLKEQMYGASALDFFGAEQFLSNYTPDFSSDSSSFKDMSLECPVPKLTCTKPGPMVSWVMRISKPISITEEQRKTLEMWVRGRNTPQKLVLRSEIILLAAQGVANTEIALRLRTSVPTVSLWRSRFEEKGAIGLEKDAPRPGRHPKLTEEKVQAVVQATLHTKPAYATQWSARTMAKAPGYQPNGCPTHLEKVSAETPPDGDVQTEH